MKRYHLGAAVLIVLIAAAYVLAIPARSLSHNIILHIDAFRLANAPAIERYYVPLLLAYFFAYALTVGICLPVTALMSVIGGFIFGFAGFVVSVLAISAGSIIPFLASRKFAGMAPARLDFELLHRVRRRFLRNQFQLLLLMRVVPWAPFSVTTIIAGSLGMGIGKFLLGTMIGFLPTGFAFYAIGHGLQHLADLGSISVARLYREPDVLIATGAVALVALLSFSRRIPLISKLLDSP